MTEDNRPGAIMCPDCGKLINANAEKCIHCGYKNPGKKSFSSIVPNLFQGEVGFIQMITIFCAALYIFSLVIDRSGIYIGSGIFNLLAPSGISLDKLGMTGRIAMINSRWWTLITAIYLHGSLMHIIFNLLWIRQLGPMVEELFGTSRLISIFTISGVLGFIVSNFKGIPYTIGASGSIFGLLGALIYYGKNRGGVFGEAIFRQLLGWAIMLFILGFLMPRINNFAHAGGFIGGYLSAMLLKYDEIKPEKPFHKTLAGVAVITTVIAFLFAFWRGVGL